MASDGDGREPQSPDYVEKMLGDQFDEAVKEEVRSFRKPAYWELLERQAEQRQSRLDPIEDVDLYLRHGLPLPPPDYQRVQQALEDEIRDLEVAKAGGSDAELIKKRRELVTHASPEQLRWLKLKAYHSAMQKLRPPAKQAEDALPASSASASTPASSTAAGGNQEEESEWVPGWDSREYLTAAQARSHPVLAAVTARALGGAGASTSAARGAAAGRRPASTGRSQPFGAVLRVTATDPAALAALEDSGYEVLQLADGAAGHVTAYRAFAPQYVEFYEKEEQLRRQRRRAAGLFWGGLLAAVGVQAVRWLVQRRRRQRRQQQRHPQDGDES